MSPDPLQGDALNPEPLNGYAYVLNNPETFIDPLGLDPCPPGANGTVSGGACVTVKNGPLVIGRGRLGFGALGHALAAHRRTANLRPRPRLKRSQTQTPCSVLRQQAAQLASTLESMSHSAAFTAAGLGVATLFGGVLELPSFGTVSPVTITLGIMSGFFGAAAIDTGAAASALNSFASGSLNPLENFAFNEIEDLALKGLASHVPKVGPWAENLANAAQQAQDLANEAPGACR